VVVQCDQWRIDIEVLQQRPGVAGVLGGDDPGPAQRFDGARADVVAMTDRGGDDMKRPGRGWDIGASGEQGRTL